MFCETSGMQPGDFPLAQADHAADNGEIVLAGGCFWCTEAVYRSLKGVVDVESGYAGGDESTANYDAVCSGSTGHAEAIRICYRPEETGLAEILRVFFAVAHNPTQLNRQGNDRGSQYRSAVFYANPQQQKVAQDYIHQLNELGAYSDPIVTTLEPLEHFYPAEEYHQDYAARNPEQPYIRGVSAPKVAKLREYFADKMQA